MKTGLTICGPDVTHKALALLSGTFGEYIRKLWILKGWSQCELAQHIETYPEAIVNWEKGRHIPQRKTIPKLIRTLDSDPWEAVKFDGVLTERQRQMLTHYNGVPSWCWQ